METVEIIDSEQEKILTPEAVSLIKGEGYHITSEVTALVVKNETQYLRAVELGTANARVLKQIEAFRKAIVQPFNDQVKRINGMFKTISERFQSNDEKVRKLILSYQNGRAKTESIQNVETDVGRATITERWTYEIIDANLVPRDYCCPDEKRIGQLVRGGALRELPGVKIWKEKTTAFCTK